MKKKPIIILLVLAMPLFMIGSFFGLIILMITGLGGDDDCIRPSITTSGEGIGEVPKSIEEFVKSHKEAYILSWKAGGFIPSASIAQTMVETGFNFTNPSGTSFWKAHNMGGVKTSKLSDFPVTIKTYGKDSVDVTGTKPGTEVGDNTGGAYTWFKDYNAGIVGKAEFMAHQTLYRRAINNTDGLSALQAIFNGGWATDPTYFTKLQTTYNTIGRQFQWLDKEAIEQYGTTPYEENKTVSDKMPTTEQDNSGCVVTSDTSGQIVNANSAPVLEVPAEYKGKLTLPTPDTNDYAGNQYPFGQCTWGAYNRMAQIGSPIQWFSGDSGNGGNWGQTARAKGYTVIKGRPSVGWAASMPGGVADAVAPYGHIAVVEYVNQDGSILISETNVVNSGSGTRSWRVLNKETVQQIEFIQGRSNK
jgi:surface antigen